MTPITTRHLRALRSADRLIFLMNRHPDDDGQDQWVKAVTLWEHSPSGVEESTMVPLGRPTVSVLDGGTFGTRDNPAHPLASTALDDLTGIVPIRTDDATTRTWLNLIRSGDELAVHFRPARTRFILGEDTVLIEDRADLIVTRPIKTGTREMKFLLTNRITCGNGTSNLVHPRLS